MSGEQEVIDLLLGEGGWAEPGMAAYQPGDDGALVPGGAVVVADAMVEGIHFDSRLSPADVGWKLVAVNASDVGACGRRPDWALLSLSLPRPLDRAWIASFAAGLREALARWGIRLVGGDTTASPGPVFASLTLGSRPGPPPVTRAGGRPGDVLWVTGALGEAAAGFAGISPGVEWLRRPEPPVELGAALAEAGLARAMMDLSDGLAADLPRLCQASGAGALVDPAALPRGPSLASEADPLPFQVAFGEDYQLLIAAAPADGAALRALAAARGVRLTAIGALTAARGARLRGREWPPAAFTHF